MRVRIGAAPCSVALRWRASRKGATSEPHNRPPRFVRSYGYRPRHGPRRRSRRVPLVRDASGAVPLRRPCRRHPHAPRIHFPRLLFRRMLSVRGRGRPMTRAHPANIAWMRSLPAPVMDRVRSILAIPHSGARARALRSTLREGGVTFNAWIPDASAGAETLGHQFGEAFPEGGDE